MKRVTIKDIANHLNLSVSTVSRALSDDKNIRKETRDKINATANDLGYHRNMIAAGLRSGHTNTIAFAGDHTLTALTSEVFHGVQEVMKENGIRILLYLSDNDSEQERDNLLQMENSMIDGIIMALSHATDHVDIFERIQGKGIPIVFFSHAPKGKKFDSVVTNSYDKAFFLIDYLVCSGRKKIVCIAGPDNIEAMSDIKKAYADALKKFKIEYDPARVISTGLKMKEGAKVVDDLMDNNVEFDAIFASTDTQAIGAINRLRERGLRVPQDVSVAGFSGTKLAQIVYPALTTVEPPYLEMGKKAAELLIEKIKDPNAPRKEIVVDAKIKLRESTHPKAE